MHKITDIQLRLLFVLDTNFIIVLTKMKKTIGATASSSTVEPLNAITSVFRPQNLRMRPLQYEDQLSIITTN